MQPSFLSFPRSRLRGLPNQQLPKCRRRADISAPFPLQLHAWKTQLHSHPTCATSPALFRYRFGSLMRAYELIGYDVPIARLVVTHRKIQAVRLQLMQELQNDVRR
jgi:hypothetical protein